MDSLKVYNHTDSVMTLMLEPVGNYFDIPPKSDVTIVGVSDGLREYAEVSLHTDCFVVWTSPDAVVMHAGKELECRK